MQQLSTGVTVDLDQELAAIVSYLYPRWANISAHTDLLIRIRDEALHDGRAWFDGQPSMIKLQKRIERREMLLQWLRKNGSRTAARGDVSMRQLSRCLTVLLGMKDLGLHVDGPWDLTLRVNRLHEILMEGYPSLNSTYPRNWGQVIREPGAQMELRQYAQNQQKADEAEFTGHCSAEPGVVSLPAALSLPHVLQAELHQKQSVPLTFVRVLYTHFLTIAKPHNTQQLVAELDSLNWKDSEQAVVTSLELEPQMPLAKAVLAAAAIDSKPDNPLERVENTLEAKRRARLKLLREAVQQPVPAEA